MKNLREPSISPEALLAEVEDVIRTMPSRDSMGNDDPDTLAWIGRASSIAHESNMLRATTMFDKHAMDLGSTNSRMYDAAFRGIVTMLHHIRSELRMRLGAPLPVWRSRPVVSLTTLMRLGKSFPRRDRTCSLLIHT